MIFVLLVLSALMGATGLYPYIRDIIRGRTRPRIVTWGVWTFLAGIMTVSALINGDIASAALSAQGLFGCGVVVILGWRHGSVRVGRLDVLSLAGAITGLLALIWLREPTVALVLSVGIDAVAFAPTLRHGWTDPDEESLACYAFNAGASTLAALAAIMAGATFVGLVYPLYSVVFNSIMAILLLSSRPTLDSSYEYGGEEV